MHPSAAEPRAARTAGRQPGDCATIALRVRATDRLAWVTCARHSTLYHASVWQEAKKFTQLIH